MAAVVTGSFPTSAMESSSVDTDKADRFDRRPLGEPVGPGSRAVSGLRIEHHAETRRQST